MKPSVLEDWMVKTMKLIDADTVQNMSDQKEIVTCKECLFCYLKDGHTGVCDNRWGMNGTVKPGDYCSRGKKREQVPERKDGRL